MLALLLSLALAADPNVPHEHTGKLTPYNSAPPTITLSADEQAKLTSGQVVVKQVQTGNGGRGVAVMEVQATPTTIWSKILSFQNYPQWVDHVDSCSVYKKESGHIYVDFKLSVMGVGTQYYINHTLNQSAGYMTWRLDYSRLSDFDDVVGFWRVTPVDADTTRIEYSVDIQFKGWVPGFIQEMISEKGLTSATSWVKEQSEKG